MDGQTLQALFSGSNPFLAQMGEQAFNLDQQKKQADLASVVGIERRAQEAQPVEIAAKQAQIRQHDAAAKYSGAMSDEIKSKLDVLNAVPLSDRVANHVAKMKSELAGDQLKQADSDMEGLLGASAAAKANGGTLPLGYVLKNPEHAGYFKDAKSANLAAEIAKAYFMNKPKELAAVANDTRDTARAVQVAQIGADSRVNAAGMRGAGGGGNKPPKTNIQAAYYYQELARNAGSEEERTQYQALAEKAQQAHDQETAQKALNAWLVANGGKPAIGQMGNIPINPAPTGKPPSRNASTQGDGTPSNPIILK